MGDSANIIMATQPLFLTLSFADYLAMLALFMISFGIALAVR